MVVGGLEGLQLRSQGVQMLLLAGLSQLLSRGCLVLVGGQEVDLEFNPTFVRQPLSLVFEALGHGCFGNG